MLVTTRSKPSRRRHSKCTPCIAEVAVSKLTVCCMLSIHYVCFAELLRDSHLTVEPAEEVSPAKASAKPVVAPKLGKIPSIPKRVNGKKVSNMKEPEFKVQRPWGGYHTAA